MQNFMNLIDMVKLTNDFDGSGARDECDDDVDDDDFPGIFDDILQLSGVCVSQPSTRVCLPTPTPKPPPLLALTNGVARPPSTVSPDKSDLPSMGTLEKFQATPKLDSPPKFCFVLPDGMDDFGQTAHDIIARAATCTPVPANAGGQGKALAKMGMPRNGHTSKGSKQKHKFKPHATGSTSKSDTGADAVATAQKNKGPGATAQKKIGVGKTTRNKKIGAGATPPEMCAAPTSKNKRKNHKASEPISSTRALGCSKCRYSKRGCKKCRGRDCRVAT